MTNMPKLARKTQAIFGSSAGSRSFTAFGTAKTDNPTYTNDPALVQNNAYLYGWEPALLADKAPYEEDTNALFYLFTYQLAYLMQQGIPEYDPGTTYYKGNVVSSLDGLGTWYKSITDGNLANPLTDTSNWQEVMLGKQGMPLFTKTIQDHILQDEDAIGWALQGSLVQGSSYSEAFEKILNQFNQGASLNYRGISCVRTPDGRYIAPSTQKTAVDNLFLSTGVADFYVIDTSVSSFFLPKNSKYLRFTTETSNINNFVASGLPSPNITINANQSITTSSAGLHDHGRGNMEITGIGSAGHYSVSKMSYSGCFYLISSSSPGDTGEFNEKTNAKFGFQASRTWTGRTSQDGAHTHTIDLGTITADASDGIYGLTTNTVDAPASIQLLYYLVGKTAV